MLSPSAPIPHTRELANDLAAALDPTVFARDVGVAPDPWQARVLRSTASRMLLNCSRQSGKSTTTAIVGLHAALYHPNALVLLLSPSLRQSAELFRKLAALYTAAGATVPPKAESALRLELENGSRVISLPGTEATIRGYSGVHLLVIDEASRVADDLYFAVRPMLATSQGRLIALSTPFGKRGWWSDAWHNDSARWERVKITAEQCPRISPDFLAEERQNLGDWWYRQEYGCEFVDTEDQLYPTDLVLGALSDDVAPLILPTLGGDE